MHDDGQAVLVRNQRQWRRNDENKQRKAPEETFNPNVDFRNTKGMHRRPC